MDLHVEKQCVEELKKGDKKHFLLLFDANFESVYKYVARRVPDKSEVEKIVKLAFLDALGQARNTPSDIGYLIWLYSLAKPRIWDYISKSSFPQKQGLISIEKKEGNDKQEEDLVDKANKMMGKLSLEEREILGLKLFEEVTDGDVMIILGFEEGAVGPRIYRVLKRAHFLLFGESEEKKGVYFGELSGFFERLRERENIEIPEVFKLSLKIELTNRIDKKDFAIDGEVVDDKKSGEKESASKEPPVKSEIKREKPTGSDDPAKVFVKAVAEMKEEEALKRAKQTAKFERREKVYNFVDRRKPLFVFLPAVILLFVIVWILFNIFNFQFGVERAYPT
ncbi:hypothetical protein GF366_04570, partial [Candidatus Peregrinibacteria bacterium]|nr:hypothetical protein [Candidatus Peregrinibacteria bacterium]